MSIWNITCDTHNKKYFIELSENFRFQYVDIAFKSVMLLDDESNSEKKTVKIMRAKPRADR